MSVFQFSNLVQLKVGEKKKKKKKERKKSVKTMASYVSVRHHGWSTQAAWTEMGSWWQFSIFLILQFQFRLEKANLYLSKLIIVHRRKYFCYKEDNQTNICHSGEFTGPPDLCDRVVFFFNLIIVYTGIMQLYFGLCMTLTDINFIKQNGGGFL